MALTYTCDEQQIELALAKLKDAGLVAQDAFFNYDAPHDLRREVAYRDFDFLSRLSRVGEAETVGGVLAWLKAKGIAGEGASYDEAAYDVLRQQVKAHFTVRGTSITPVMARLLYMLSSIKRPQRVIGLGTYCAYALVWAVGASCGPQPAYTPATVVGIDIDPQATQLARENLTGLASSDHIELLAEDGLQAVDRLPGPWDTVFLDVDGSERGKGLYLDLLEKLYPKLAPGAWVLAHDTVVPPFADQLAPYLDQVRDKRRFQESISFHVDAYGLELSIVG